MVEYKLRIYKQKGKDKGSLDREEFFKTEINAIERYNELRNPDNFSYNPTLWKRNKDDWERVEGY